MANYICENWGLFDGKHLWVYSDLRSALQAIDNPIVHSLTVARTSKALDRAGGIPGTLEILWVKAHIGTLGNKAADEQAKLGAEKEKVKMNIPLAGSFIKTSFTTLFS